MDMICIESKLGIYTMSYDLSLRNIKTEMKQILGSFALPKTIPTL